MNAEPGVDAVTELLRNAVSRQVFSAAVLLAGEAGAAPRCWAEGHTARVPDVGEAVTAATWFDLASLTKIIATTAVAMRLVERGALELDAPVLPWLPELGAGDARKQGITARHLLAHTAGLNWWQPLYRRLWAGERLGAASAREALVRMAAAEPLDAAPGTRAVYTDFGFILLGALIERVGGARLDTLAETLVWAPLGMRATRYVDLEAVAAGAAARPAPVAATEQCARRGLVVGEVHDENCHAAGGVTGHAGVFGQAGDVGRFADAVVRAWHGARDAVFAPEVVRGFCRRAGPAGSTRALGWDTPSAGVGASQAGDRWPREDAVGHMGFTGTSLWVDLRGARWVVLLTNRVHPLRADERIKAVRPLLMGTVFRSLEVSA